MYRTYILFEANIAQEYIWSQCTPILCGWRKIEQRRKTISTYSVLPTYDNNDVRFRFRQCFAQDVYPIDAAILIGICAAARRTRDKPDKSSYNVSSRSFLLARSGERLLTRVNRFRVDGLVFWMSTLRIVISTSRYKVSGCVTIGCQWSEATLTRIKLTRYENVWYMTPDVLRWPFECLIISFLEILLGQLQIIFALASTLFSKTIYEKIKLREHDDDRHYWINKLRDR